MLRLIKSFSYAFKGLSHTFKSQLNFKVHLMVLILVIVLGVLFKLALSEWLWITLAATLVLASELINTAIEALVDLVSPEHHPKAGIVKDVAAAAVLICAIAAIVIGLIILIPKIF